MIENNNINEEEKEALFSCSVYTYGREYYTDNLPALKFHYEKDKLMEQCFNQKIDDETFWKKIHELKKKYEELLS